MGRVRPAPLRRPRHGAVWGARRALSGEESTQRRVGAYTLPEEEEKR